MAHGTHSVTLKANKAGTATITATADDASNTAGTEEVTGTRSVTIEVKEPEKALDTSSAKLKSITVAGKTYNNPNQDMTVNVGADVGSTTVSAVANDGNAKISGTGNKELGAGINTVVLTVTGSNGAVLKYTVRIKKAAATNNTPNITGTNEPTPEPTPEPEQVPELLRLSYLLVDDAELMPAFDAETFEYRVSVTNTDHINVAANANDENAIIEIKGDKELVEGDNEVTVTLTRGEGESQEQTIYTIIVTKSIEEVTPIEEIANDNNSNDGGFLGSTTGKIVAGAVILIAVGAIEFFIIRGKMNDEPSYNSRREARRRASLDDFND